MFETEVLSFARLIRERVGRLLGLDVQIGLSTPYRNISDIPRAYEEAAEVLKRRSLLGDDPIVRFADLGENHSLYNSYPHLLQSELFDAVKLADKNKAEPLLQELMTELRSKNPDPHDLQFNTIRLLMNLLHMASGVEGESIPLNRQQLLFDEIFRLNIANEGEAWFMDNLIMPLMNDIEQQTGARHLAMIKEAVRIIHEEYDKDLTIDYVAEQLHYNASYVSTIFRKNMDMPFSAYLAQFRHQIALRWLKETDMPIKEIAEKLRYNNSQNFIRSFRKLENVSPGKYREQERGTQSREIISR
jgi:YesN/AraC family two-component response regulator